jgi:hypothetical protein
MGRKARCRVRKLYGDCSKKPSAEKRSRDSARRARRLEGIAEAQGRWRLQGPSGLDAMKAGRAKAASEIAKALKIGRASVYRALEGS